MSAPLVIGLAAITAAAMAVYLAARCRDARRDMEALIEATREETPEDALDRWTREYGR